MRRVSPTLVRRWPWTLVAVLSCLMGGARPAAAQQLRGQASPVVSPAIGLETARQEWFFNQRRYGLGYIPDDALAKAIAQRDGVKVGKTALATALTTDVSPDDAPAITTGHWVSFGPLGINSAQTDLVSGRVNSLAIDPANPSTLYLAAAGGGVWKSTNRGGHWTPLTRLNSPRWPRERWL